MKKIVLILFAAVLALMSCNKELTPNEVKQGEPIDVVFNLSATHPDGADTKAVKTAWETGDVVFVFFSEQTAPAYLELKYDGTKWVNTPKDLSFKTGETGNMTAVYLPFGSGATVVDDGSGGYKFDKTYYSYFLTSSMTYDVSGGEVSGTFNMQIPTGYVQFFVYVPESYFNKPVELREPHLTPMGVASISKTGDVVTTTLAQGAPLPGYVYKKESTSSDEWGFVFSGILAAEVHDKMTNYHFTMVYDGWKGSYFSHDFTGWRFYRDEKIGRALKLPDSGWTPITDYKPIDLGCDVTVDGVTKRIYWCSRNLGAQYDEAPVGETDPLVTTRGNYYAWGETDTKSDYSWVTYKHIVDPPYDTDYYWKGINKYTVPFPDSYPDKKPNVAWYNSNGDFIGDNLTVLEPKDDAARSLLGGLWRIPTEAEWQALNDATSFEWNRGAFDLNKGIKVYSNVDGYLYVGGPYIYLPAATYWKGNAQDTVLDGVCGYYWTATLNELDVPSALYVFFNSSWQKIGSDTSEDRCIGLQVRAVMD